MWVYFDSSYYLYPDGPIAVEALRVIGAAMAEGGVIGLGRLTRAGASGWSPSSRAAQGWRFSLGGNGTAAGADTATALQFLYEEIGLNGQ